MYREHGAVITSLEIEAVTITTRFFEELEQLCRQNFTNIGRITFRSMHAAVCIRAWLRYANKMGISSLTHTRTARMRSVSRVLRKAASRSAAWSMAQTTLRESGDEIEDDEQGLILQLETVNTW
jgi:hypothetical protein